MKKKDYDNILKAVEIIKEEQQNIIKENIIKGSTDYRTDRLSELDNIKKAKQQEELLNPEKKIKYLIILRH